MNIKTLVTGAFEVNCYILWDKAKKALIIDPGFDSEKIFAAINSENLTVAAYLCTHGHADHINALSDLQQKLPAPIHMHSADWKWAFNDTNQIPPYYTVPKRPKIDNTALETSAQWKIEDMEFNCIETPGHTPGCICFHFPETKNLFTGDTLFKGSCGRTDLPGGNARQLSDSLKHLATLPDQTRIYPGHGSDSTIGHEKATNFFMMQP